VTSSRATPKSRHAGPAHNLLHEADLYRYPFAKTETTQEGAEDSDSPSTENPIDANNHALAALRYLIARIDKHKQIAGPPSTPSAPSPRRNAFDDDDPRWARIA
jgi:hypothetical protein